MRCTILFVLAISIYGIAATPSMHEESASKEAAGKDTVAPRASKEAAGKERQMKSKMSEEILTKQLISTKEVGSKESEMKQQRNKEWKAKETVHKKKVYGKAEQSSKEDDEKDKEKKDEKAEVEQEVQAAKMQEFDAERADQTAQETEQYAEEGLKTAEVAVETDTNEHDQKLLSKEEQKKETQVNAVADAVHEKDEKTISAHMKVQNLVRESAFKSIGRTTAEELLVKERVSKVSEDSEKASAKENQVKGRQEELDEKIESSSNKVELASKQMSRAGGGEGGEKASSAAREARQKKGIAQAYLQENSEKVIELQNKADEKHVKAQASLKAAENEKSTTEKDTKTQSAKIVEASSKEYQSIKAEQRKENERQFENGQKVGYQQGNAGGGYEKGEKGGIKSRSGDAFELSLYTRGCKQVKKCPPGLIIKRICYKTAHSGCCNQCVPDSGVPIQNGKPPPHDYAPGASSWKEVWRKNMGRWRGAVATSGLAPTLSHAELGPVESNAMPYVHAKKMSKASADIANFADGEAQHIIPNNNQTPLEKTKAAANSNGESAAKSSKGWREVWQKNMSRWRSELPTTPHSTPGALSSAELQPDPGSPEPYPKGVARDSLTREDAIKAPFSG